MILEYGKKQILGFFAGANTSIADTFVLGVGNALDNGNLGFETVRVPVDIVGLDYSNSQVIFKGRLPNEFSGVISEIGLYQGQNQIMQEDVNVSFFPGGTAVADWTTLNSSTGTYIKEDSLRVQNETSVSNIDVDLTDFNSEDVIKLLVSASTSASLTVRIGKDASNYYQYTFNVSSGKNVLKKTLGDRTTTGSPGSAVSYLSLTSTTSVVLEGIRLENSAVKNPSYGMVAYQSLSTPIDKPFGTEREIEYAMTIGVA